jgi:DNA-binding transcriptional LysR family regulator
MTRAGGGGQCRLLLERCGTGMTLDLAYLLDFQALAELGNFSRAATLRNMTQPAFSRRIRALEDWAGTPLFHRATSPVTLSDAGRALQPAVSEALLCLARGRDEARAAASRDGATLHFAATHVLSFTFFPSWLRGLEGGQPLEAVQLSSDSLSACEQLMQQGQAQFLLCHHHPAAPVRLEPARFHSIRIGTDLLMPVSAPGEAGEPLHVLSPEDATPVPYLAYSEESGLGRIVAAALPERFAHGGLEPVFTSHLAAALRSMAATGRGVAWLPQSLIQDDVASGRLVRAGPASLDVTVGIHLFRPVSALGSAAERFWGQLAEPNA